MGFYVTETEKAHPPGRSYPRAAVASVEPDPFGSLIASSEGAYISSTGGNAFRFSTKYFIAEVGVYDYGYRPYSPTLGRWLNRDPLEEPGFEISNKSIEEGSIVPSPEKDISMVTRQIPRLDSSCSRSMTCWDWLMRQSSDRLAEIVLTERESQRRAVQNGMKHPLHFADNRPIDSIDALGLTAVPPIEPVPRDPTARCIYRCQLQYDIDKAICTKEYGKGICILYWPICMEKARSGMHDCVWNCLLNN